VEDLLHRLLQKLVLTAFLAVLSLSVTACGSSEENQVEETVRAFYRAAAEGDGEEACEQLTPAATTPAGGVRCEDAIDQLGDLGGKAAERRLAAVEVRNVEVRGKQAMVEAVIPTQAPTPLRLRKVERSVLPALEPLPKWKLDSVGTGPAGGF
jgi:hypothetical protein